MARSKRTTTDDTADTTGSGGLEATLHEAQEKGYLGHRADDAPPFSDFTLPAQTSGATAPEGASTPAAPEGE